MKRRERIRPYDVVLTNRGYGVAKYPASYWQGSQADWWVEFDGKPGEWMFRKDMSLVQRGGLTVKDRQLAIDELDAR